MLFLIFFMWHFALVVEVGRCFISSTVSLGQVVKWPFLNSWSKVFFTRLKRSAWYHLDRSGLILAARVLSVSGCCLVGGWLELLVSLTCHMPDVVDWFPSSTVRPSLNELR